jgi:hypothetical protein
MVDQLRRDVSRLSFIMRNVFIVFVTLSIRHLVSSPRILFTRRQLCLRTASDIFICHQISDTTRAFFLSGHKNAALVVYRCTATL